MSESLAEFVSYYNTLPKVKGTCRVYERNDGYSIYGDDAILVNEEVLKASRLKTAQSGNETLTYLNISKVNFIQALRYLLFVRQYKIEIFKNTGSIRSQTWTISIKASPGNLTAVEDLLFGENLSSTQESQGLMSVKIKADSSELVLGVAFCDPILREFKICQFVDDSEFINLQSILVQLSPKECLLPVSSNKQSSVQILKKVLELHEIATTDCKSNDFNTTDVVQDLKRLLCDNSSIDVRNVKEDAELGLALGAVASIIKYLDLLSDEYNFEQYSLSLFQSQHYAKIDMQSISGLGLFPELTSDLSDKHYLFGHLNSCSTRIGERLLVQWIKQPLMDIRKLEERLDTVEVFVNDFSLKTEASKHLLKFPDIETLSRKIQRRKANLQDLYRLYVMMIQLPGLVNILSQHSGPLANVLKNNFVTELEERIDDFKNFTSMIETILDFEALKNKEFIIKAEYDEELQEIQDQLVKFEKKIRRTLDEVQSDLDSAAVKLESDKSVGYFFRLTRKDEKNLRQKKGYMIIDTKASGIRFQNKHLKDLNEQYVSYKKIYEDKQKAIVEQTIEVSVSYIQPLRLLSHTIAYLDVALSFAHISVTAVKPYVRPKLRNKGDCYINLKKARHPVLESKTENFIPNDVTISKDNHIFYFVTGPNMGGKSTYIRSVALNVLMAQIGCFVPCDYAEISITDAFLTRIGANDKPSKAMSTFMFEMTEVQTIIKSATSASLLVIDEMGRGTSTYDGFGLSWGISRYIAEEIKAPCLFATHFHELTELSKFVSTIGNLHVDAMSTDGDIIFLYNVKPGICDESFGIHVAKLAEFPETVIKRATEKLSELDKTRLPIAQILEKFSNVPGGEVIIQALEKKISGSISSIDSQSSDKTSNTLEILANALESLAERQGLK